MASIKVAGLSSKGSCLMVGFNPEMKQSNKASDGKLFVMVVSKVDWYCSTEVVCRSLNKTAWGLTNEDGLKSCSKTLVRDCHDESCWFLYIHWNQVNVCPVMWKLARSMHCSLGVTET